MSTLTYSAESQVLYPNYYRLNGIRMPMQLLAPTVRPISALLLPREPLVHYIPDTETTMGPPEDDPIFKGNKKALQVEHVTTMTGTLGGVRSSRVAPTPLIREYHRKRRGTRWLRNFDSFNRDPNSIIVENYGILPHLVRYPVQALRPYFRWQCGNGYKSMVLIDLLLMLVKSFIITLKHLPHLLIG